MADPLTIVEQIARAIQTALEAVTIANGYTVNVAEVVRPRRSGMGYTPKDLGIVLLQGPRERASEYDAIRPPTIGWRQTFGLDLLRRINEDDTTPIDTGLNEFEGQAVKALMADPTWGGLAVKTEMGEPDYPAPGESVEGLTLTVMVDYRVAEADPYTQP